MSREDQIDTLVEKRRPPTAYLPPEVLRAMRPTLRANA
jgi:hypothetical protein